MATPLPIQCLVLSDGRRGIENQALGVAESLARHCKTEISTYQIHHSRIFRALPPKLQRWLKPKISDYRFKLPRSNLNSPIIVIGCGRQAIAPLMAIKSAQSSQAFCVYIQDPRLDPQHFDLVIAPKHDGLTGENVISMIGAPNRITPEILKHHAEVFIESLRSHPSPRALILMGGSSKTHKITKKIHEQHKQTIKALLSNGFSVLMTTSRRTPKWVSDYYRLLDLGHENLWVWDNMGDNPYMPFLSAADIIFVTEDSTNMLTEASTTGVPVMRLPMHGRSKKFDLLYEQLLISGQARLFEGAEPIHPDMIRAQYPPMEETTRIVRILKQKYDEHCHQI